jgi:hypothetical protein
MVSPEAGLASLGFTTCTSKSAGNRRLESTVCLSVACRMGTSCRRSRRPRQVGRLKSLSREGLAGYRWLRLPARSHPWASTH